MPLDQELDALLGGKPPPARGPAPAPAATGLDAALSELLGTQPAPEDGALRRAARSLARYAKRETLPLFPSRQVQQALDVGSKADRKQFLALVQEEAGKIKLPPGEAAIESIGVIADPLSWREQRRGGLLSHAIPSPAGPAPLGHVFGEARRGMRETSEALPRYAMHVGSWLQDMVGGKGEATRERARLLGEATRAARGELPEPKDAMERALRGFARMAPAMYASGAVGGQTVAAATRTGRLAQRLPAIAFWAAQITPDRYQQYRNEGLPDRSANIASMAGGLTEAAVEMIGPLGRGRGGKAMSKAVRETAHRTVFRFFWKGLKELVEEPTQEGVSELFKRGVEKAVAYIEGRRASKFPNDVLERMWRTTEEAAMPIALMMLTGVGGGQIQADAQQALLNRLERVGVDLDQIEVDAVTGRMTLAREAPERLVQEGPTVSAQEARAAMMAGPAEGQDETQWQAGLIAGFTRRRLQEGYYGDNARAVKAAQTKLERATRWAETAPTEEGEQKRLNKDWQRLLRESAKEARKAPEAPPQAAAEGAPAAARGAETPLAPTAAPEAPEAAVPAAPADMPWKQLQGRARELGINPFQKRPRLLYQVRQAEKAAE